MIVFHQVKAKGVTKSAPISIFLPSINDRYGFYPMSITRYLYRTEYGPLAVGDLAATREEGIASRRQVMDDWVAR